MSALAALLPKPLILMQLLLLPLMFLFLISLLSLPLSWLVLQ